jgi:hypothetical protein
LRNADSIFILAAKLYEKFLAILSWIGEDDIEIVQGEFLSFEADLGSGFVIDLSLHGFDEIETGLIGFNLDLRCDYFEGDNSIHEVGDCYFRVHLLSFTVFELHGVGEGAKLGRVDILYTHGCNY